MKRLTTILLILIALTDLSKAQGFFDYSFSTRIRTPVGKYMFNGDNGITDIPDSTECILVFNNKEKNDPPEFNIIGRYIKKVGGLFLFTSSSKISFLVDVNQNSSRPLLSKNFIPIDTTKLNKITTEKQMFEVWRTNIYFANKDLMSTAVALPDEGKLNAIQNIKNWPYYIVESVLIKLSADKNPEVSKSAKKELEYWRKSFLPILVKS